MESGHAVSSGAHNGVSLLFDDDELGGELLSESSGALETGDFNNLNAGSQGDAGGGGVGYASMAASLEEEYRKHIVDLEEKVASLAEESAIAAEAHVLELKRRDDETAALLDDVAQLKEAHEQMGQPRSGVGERGGEEGAGEGEVRRVGSQLVSAWWRLRCGLGSSLDPIGWVGR